MLKKLIRSAVAAAAGIFIFAAMTAVNTSAEWERIGCMGDLNHDSVVDAADLVMLAKHLNGSSPLTVDDTYYIGYRAYMIENEEADDNTEHLVTADINRDGRIDIFDLVAMRGIVMSGSCSYVYSWKDNNHNSTTTTTTTTTTVTTAFDANAPFIDAPVKDVLSYLPSQGDAELVVFYVDFPDCPYEYAPSEAEISDIIFGQEDESNPNYPFESISAFYKRSSKGAMKLQGRVFRYTAKESVHKYKHDKARLAFECFAAFDESVDFSQFDGDGDDHIDTTIITVPREAGSDDWWPSSVPFGMDTYTVDGVKLGHFITSNDQINAADDYYDFNSTCLHEMGHCMGLPDYYLYGNTESEGMHGVAGSEMMDIDASTDFCAFSKLQLGWYRENQVQVYTGSGAKQSFTLKNAQTDAGNCVIIPRGHLDSHYESEYFVIEFCTPDRNNSHPFWWQKTGTGVRIYHIEAELYDNGWWVSYKYENCSEFVTDPDGKRLIRLVNDAEHNFTDNYLKAGDVVDSSVKGFGWYNNTGAEIIDPGLKITVGEFENDSCTITIQGI